MRYEGSCHCGDVVFQVDGDIESAVECNCSICSRKGALLWAVPRAALSLRTPDEAMGTYLFNNNAIAHRFCRRCGMHPFAEDAGSAEDRSAYVNLRCVDGVDLKSLPILAFDGRSM